MPNPRITTSMTYEENLALKQILWTLFNQASDNKTTFEPAVGKELDATKLWKLYFKMSKRGWKLDRKWLAAL